jgi:hypothetical protein
MSLNAHNLLLANYLGVRKKRQRDIALDGSYNVDGERLSSHVALYILFRCTLDSIIQTGRDFCVNDGIY